jgi:hypothetical protein
MINKDISVPDFFADDFERPLHHINPAKDSVDRSVERVYRLIQEALKGLEHADWDVGQRRYHSTLDLEPYCFSRLGDKFYIWAEERGRKAPIAVFKSRYMAAKYFVWLVSKGKREINWELFMDMEP